MILRILLKGLLNMCCLVIHCGYSFKIFNRFLELSSRDGFYQLFIKFLLLHIKINILHTNIKKLEF